MLKIPIFKIIKHSKNISNEKKFGKGPLKILESEMEKKCLNSLIISAFPNISNRKDKPNMAKKRPEKTFQVTFFQENHKVGSISAFSLEKKPDSLRGNLIFSEK